MSAITCVGNQAAFRDPCLAESVAEKGSSLFRALLELRWSAVAQT